MSTTASITRKPIPTMPSTVSAKSNSKWSCARQAQRWRAIFLLLLQRRRRSSGSQSSAALLYSFRRYIHWRLEFHSHIRRTAQIAITRFEIVFTNLTDEYALSLFRFRKKEISDLSEVLTSDSYSTYRNQYRTTPILSLCIILRRMASPCRWRDLKCFFGKHTSQVSEIFWETVELILKKYASLITGPLQRPYIHRNCHRYAAVVRAKTNALSNCIAFIDGAVIGITRPQHNVLQNVVYNGHKRKHSLKYQAITMPDGMFLHMFGPLEGRRHDWTLYSRSDIDAQLATTFLRHGTTFFVYRDSGYNSRKYLCTPFQEALNEDQRKFNEAMSSARVTVEWMFKDLKLFWTTMDVVFYRFVAVEPLRCRV